MLNSAARLLAGTAARFPERAAVEDERGAWTWRELKAQTEAVATAIVGMDFGPNRPVLVYLPKNKESVAAYLAALYAGCPYAPLDYAVPLGRLQKTIENLAPALIVTDEAGREVLSGLDVGTARVSLYTELAVCPADAAALERSLGGVIDTDPAYIMYTSGSTGTPKGVTIAHRGILDYAAWVVETFGLTEQSVLGLQSGFHFDNCVFDLYGCLMTGAKLVIIPEILFMYPQKLMDFVADKQVTCVFWVPTVMISVANSGALEGRELPHLKTVAFAGEVMPNKHLNIWRRALPHCTYANLYGPTEITVDCTCYLVDRDFADSDSLPIGKPCANSRVVLLTGDGKIAGEGEEGELCVIGSSLALGYWNAPELTEKAFVPNPLNPNWGERMYRTGDIARWEADGNLTFLGRRDHQFKLRGNRIELGDIETAASTLPGVENVCALFDEGAQEIMLVVQSGEMLSLRKLNAALGKLIPKYMLPKRLEVMPALPMTANRKIDRGGLKRELLKEG